jgi:hypothetical protein
MPNRNSEVNLQSPLQAGSLLVESALQDTAARSDRVNRTHRVVRERAKSMKARRSKLRSLWLPLGIFSSLLVGICVAVWSVLDQYDLTPTGTPVASYQMLVLLLWSVPVSAALLAVVWFRQSRTDAGTSGRY